MVDKISLEHPSDEGVDSRLERRCSSSSMQEASSVSIIGPELDVKKVTLLKMKVMNAVTHKLLAGWRKSSRNEIPHLHQRDLIQTK